MDRQLGQEMQPIHRGDTLSFPVTFLDVAEEPIDITGMILYYTMKIDVSEDALGAFDLQESITFPVGEDSQNGVGVILIPADRTLKLHPEKTYKYDFQLVNAGAISTIGWGTVDVLRDVTTIVAEAA